MTTSNSIPTCTISEAIRLGTTNVIYRGVRNGSTVIVKALKSDYPTTRQVATLRHEYEILQALELPGVIRVLGLAEDGNRPVLLLEDFGGQALSEFIATRTIDLPTFLRVAIALAETLEGIHRQGILHKDLKPQNILFNPDTNQVKIADFGIASRLSQESQRVSDPHRLAGTLAYMSPEQTGRVNRVIDYRTDFYSLGVTFYEMLTGRLPFLATDSLELIHSHIARQPVPPHELTTTVPEAVSNIVMKLLAKMAEDRYQRAASLKADLQECLRQWETTGTILPFPPGQHDISETLHISQKLYGREEETRQLLTAFERVSQGSTELILLSGYAGAGKTMLVQEIQKPVVRQRGFFISGSFDQHTRGMPYTAIVQAFAELIRQLLTESDERIGEWRRHLLAALGTNGRVITDLIPDLELIIGPQPPVPEVGIAETQNRFQMTIQNFVGVLASPEHPLVLFLDDLQWADLASLKLLQLLTTDFATRYLLVIGAYRENEVPPDHPLMTVLSDLQHATVTIHHLVLGPLELAQVNQLLAASLCREPEQMNDLTDLVFKKTDGNPFFVNQFLKTIYQEGSLWFDAHHGQWSWDLERIQAATVTENVVEFMARSLRKLSPPTQRVLQLAAGIGHQFDLRLLSVIAGQSPQETARNLWEAIQEGLVIPLNDDYRLLHTHHDHDSAPFLTNGNGQASDSYIAYRFLHDRIQQAAYTLLPSEQAPQVHLIIGRLLLAQTSPAEREEKAFAIVNQLNIGRSLMTDPQERIELAHLNLLAGKKSRAASAYDAASTYLATGVELLSDAGWQHQYELMLALHHKCAVCEYLAGHVETAENLFDTILSHARSDTVRADVAVERMQIYANLGRYADALAVGLEGLHLFGITFPDGAEEQQSAMQEALGDIQRNLEGRTLQDLLEAPLLEDPEKRTILKLLVSLIVPSFNVRPGLYPLITFTMVNLSLHDGNAPESAFGYGLYGMYLSAMGDYQAAYTFGKLAFDLGTRVENTGLLNKIYNTFGAFIDVWKNHLSSSIAILKQAHLMGIELGDVVYAGFACGAVIHHELIAALPLPEVYEDIQKYLTFVRQTRNTAMETILTIFQQIILNLQGQTHDTASLTDDQFDEAQCLEHMQQMGFSSLFNFYAICKAQVLFLHGHDAEALEMVIQAEQTIGSNPGAPSVSETAFASTLIRAAAYPTIPEHARPEYREILQRNQEQLRTWAEHCPENFRHKYVLATAELHRLAGETEPAIQHYEQAIELAEQQGFTQDVAIASELLAKVYLAQRKEKFARVYLLDACQGYLKWGATTKARALVERYPALLGNLVSGSFLDSDEHTTTSSSSSSLRLTINRQAGMLDIMAIIKATQVIAGEIVLEQLLDKLMAILVENAGAQKGVLVLEHEGRLTVEIVMTVEERIATAHPAAPLENSSDLCVPIIQYVLRSRKHVALSHANRQNRFADDPYILAYGPKSILALPLIHQGQLIGGLYLENNLVAGAFQTERIELLKVLSLQGAIAIRNALLYREVRKMSEHLQQMNEDLEEANRSLEQKVAQRTAELSQTNQQLQVELVERERVEAERTQLQEEIIQMQAATLAELSTPLIPIADHIVVMPLIGKMDTQRADAVMSTLLNGVAEWQARVVIIDITGVPTVDTSVASTLIDAARSVRLLGTQTVITGIRPEVATTLVHLGVDLSTIRTVGTLQAGIAYAMRQLPAALKPRW
ncbi:MAG: AAA family ATPase [Chloroflexaceae bacterium]|nr:AAA family ATPase [Chloroflexaceae bacterium]